MSALPCDGAAAAILAGMLFVSGMIFGACLALFATLGGRRRR